MVSPNRRAEVLQQFRDTAATYGWAVVGVFPTETSPGHSFSYTAGLTALGHPELIVFGLPPSVAGPILNDDGSRLRDGEELAYGVDLFEVVAENIPIRLLPIPDSEVRERLTVARSIAPAGATVTALQLVWPGIDGAWPWEPGHPTHLQPLIALEH